MPDPLTPVETRCHNKFILSAIVFIFGTAPGGGELFLPAPGAKIARYDL